MISLLNELSEFGSESDYSLHHDNEFEKQSITVLRDELRYTAEDDIHNYGSIDRS